MQMSDDSPATAPNDRPVPNHHASHPGFSGVTGLVAAVSFLFGRDRNAKLAIDLAQLGAGDRLVDIGCGPGPAVQRARATGAQVIGVDPSTVMLRVARWRWRTDPDVSWRIGTAERLPVEAGWATAAWSLATVHHWADVAAALTEVERVLQPGGRLVVLERKIRDTSAEGVASHGWTTDQADSFATECRRYGFVDVEAGSHPGDRGTVLSVIARLPAT